MLLAGCAGDFRPTGERGDGGKIAAKVVQLYGERLDDFPEYICSPRLSGWQQPTRRH